MNDIEKILKILKYESEFREKLNILLNKDAKIK